MRLITTVGLHKALDATKEKCRWLLHSLSGSITTQPQYLTVNSK